jgi:hypothetical protein
MAYDKKKIFNDVINAIRENKLKHFEYITGYVEPSTPTLYEFFPLESNEFNTIKSELELNKIAAKTKMRNKWEDSDNPTLQIAAFKLIATDEEQKALSTNWTKNEHDVEIKSKDIAEYTTEELAKRAESIRTINGTS